MGRHSVGRVHRRPRAGKNSLRDSSGVVWSLDGTCRVGGDGTCRVGGDGTCRVGGRGGKIKFVGLFITSPKILSRLTST